MPDTPANQRSWWRQPPLWVGAAPLLIFLLVSAIDLALAKQFTDNGKAVISDAQYLDTSALKSNLGSFKFIFTRNFES